MRKFMLIAALLIAAPAIAQDTPTPATTVAKKAEPAKVLVKAAVEVKGAVPIAASPVVEHIPVTKTVEHLAPDASTEEVIEAAFATIEEAQEYFKARESDTKKAFVWAAVLAALLKLLIMVIRRTSPFWKKRKGKTVIRLLTITLGIGAGVLANLAIGMPWWDAVTIFLGGPGAILLTEYQKVFKTDE